MEINVSFSCEMHFNAQTPEDGIPAYAGIKPCLKNWGLQISFAEQTYVIKDLITGVYSLLVIPQEEQKSDWLEQFKKDDQYYAVIGRLSEIIND